MSIEYWITLFGPPPTVEALDTILAAFGGARGTWEYGISCAEIGLQQMVEPDEEIIALVREALGAGREVPREVVVSVYGRTQTAIDVGKTLVAATGGAFISEEGELLDYVEEDRAGAVAPPAHPDVDVTIPPEVERAFKLLTDTHRRHRQVYTLAARSEPTVRFGVLVSALPTRPAEVFWSREGTWDENGVGEVILREVPWPSEPSPRGPRLEDDLLEAGVPEAVRVFRISLGQGDAQSISAADWTAMLAIVCGLARNTRGVLYRHEEGRLSRHDFSPGEDPAAREAAIAAIAEEREMEAVLPSYDRHKVRTIERGTGRMVVTGSKVLLSWVVRDLRSKKELARSTAPSAVVIGSDDAHPVLEDVLNGAKVGAKLEVTLHGARNMEHVIPPCPNGESKLELVVDGVEDVPAYNIRWV